MASLVLPRRSSTIRLHRLALGVITVVAVTASACGASDDTSAAPPTEPEAAQSTSIAADLMAADEDGVTAVDEALLDSELEPLPTDTLSDFDRDGLVFMREEEKLALDVYRALYETWSLKIFNNIAGAEQTHTNSVKTLLDRWEIADPALDQTAGVFVNPDLQALYDDLVAKGNESLVDALVVGATIEDLDISDLQARVSEDPAIALVYANLEKGSRNHLRAFVKQLEANGGTYTPTYISQSAYDEIVSSSTERGRSN